MSSNRCCLWAWGQRYGKHTWTFITDSGIRRPEDEFLHMTNSLHEFCCNNISRIPLPLYKKLQYRNHGQEFSAPSMQHVEQFRDSGIRCPETSTNKNMAIVLHEIYNNICGQRELQDRSRQNTHEIGSEGKKYRNHPLKSTETTGPTRTSSTRGGRAWNGNRHGGAHLSLFPCSHLCLNSALRNGEGKGTSR